MVVGQCAAAALALGQDHLDPVAVEQADRRLVEVRPQHALGTAAQQRDPAAALGRCLVLTGLEEVADLLRRGIGGEGARPVGAVAVRQLRRGEVEHRCEPVADPRQPGDQRPERRPDLGRQQRHPEPVRIGQHQGQHRAQEPVRERARVGLLDMGAGMIDEVHVVHARRTGRHAGQAGEAAVDVLDHFAARRLAALQHVLDEVDASAR
ncbi:hypothetical protein M2437_003585 [Methylorubrum pseudosasae]|nr:hypothetical protein [Methylorubrum pseudosasae]